MAFRAGIQQAATATAVRTAARPANVAGSVALMPWSSRVIRRVRVSAAPSPMGIDWESTGDNRLNRLGTIDWGQIDWESTGDGNRLGGIDWNRLGNRLGTDDRLGIDWGQTKSYLTETMVELLGS
jgi:hypothetical protein